MQCPYCSFDSTKVVDSRLTEPGDAVRRRRQCEGCGERFTTYERAELSLTVIKRGGRREPFDREKLLRGLQRAAAKRPIDEGRLEELVTLIAAAVRRGGGEAHAEQVGDLALGGLARLDRVAAVMFASVYRSIEDLSEFEAELRRLEAEPVAGPDQLALDPLAEPTIPSGSESILPSPVPAGEKPRNSRKSEGREDAVHA
jgi:transcriptional repressor NrdR